MKTDFDCADDIALVFNWVKQAQEMLHRVEAECKNVGLRLNAKKTEVMAYNVARRDKNSRWSSAELNRRFQVPGITYWFLRERYTNQEGLSMASFALYE